MEDDGRMDAVARCFMGEVVLFQYTWAPNGCEKRFCVASGYAAVRKRLKAKSRCGAESRESDPQQLHAGLLLLLQQASRRNSGTDRDLSCGFAVTGGFSEIVSKFAWNSCNIRFAEKSRLQRLSLSSPGDFHPAAQHPHHGSSSSPRLTFR